MAEHYVIRGGREGRERLRLLARVMRPSTLELWERAGVRPGMACWDVGCGGGDVAFELARLVGPSGTVVGTDLDQGKLDLARREAEAQGLPNVDFRVADVGDGWDGPPVDLVYARFLLSHLPDPWGALAAMHRALRPGGLVAVEDVDFAGHFCHPPSAAFRRYVDLYARAVRRRGGDPEFGRRLPLLLLDAGFAGVGVHVVQPVAFEGEVKLVNPLTMAAIAPAVVAEGLASEAEVARLVAELEALARDRGTVMSAARVVQAWGVRSDA